MEALDDAELMRLCAEDNVAAFSVLVQRYETKVRGFCRKWVNNAAAGDDMAQEAFCDVWKARARYRAEGTFAAFVFTVARNRCIAMQRRRRKEVPEQEINSVTEGRQLHSVLEKEQAQLVQQALQELPVKLQEAVRLRFDAGLDYHEIAALLKCPESTVRSRVFHAVSHLRSQLAGEE